MKTKNNLIWFIPILLIIFLFSIWPILISLSDAFISDGKLSFDNFYKVFNDDLFLKALLNSIIFSFGTFFSIGISIYLMLIIISLSNNIAKNTFISIIFLQYMFLGLAVSSGYIFIFATEDGVLNLILSLCGISNINFLNDPSWSMCILFIINVISSLPFLTSTFVFRGLSYIKSKEDLIRTNGISTNDSIIKKSILINMSKYIILVSYFIFIQNLLSYPVALFSNDLSAVFVAKSQTLVCYINRCIAFGNYSNAAVCSVVTLTLITFLTFIYYLIYIKILRGQKC